MKGSSSCWKIRGGQLEKITVIASDEMENQDEEEQSLDILEQVNGQFSNMVWYAWGYSL